MMDIHFPSGTNVITSHRRGRNRCVLNRWYAGFRKAICSSAVALMMGVLLGGMVERVVAQDTSSAGCQITDLQIGIKNHFRLGCWTQVRMSLQSPNAYAQARVEMELPDGEGMRCVYVTRDVRIPVGESRVVTNLKVGRTDSSFKVRIYAEDQLVAEKDYLPDDLPDGVFGSQFLVLTLGSDLGVRETISQRREDDSEQTVAVQVTDVDQLPSEWLGYGGVNVIVVPTSLQSVAAQMSAKQVDALKTWVRMGGRVILSGGAESEPLFQAGGKLADLLPGKYDGVRMQRETSNFEGYAGKTRLSLSSFPANPM